MSEAQEKQATKYETVTMDDGREVKFAGSRKLVKTTEISEDKFTVTVRLDFRNGESRVFKAEASDALFAKFAAHGIEQKLGDEIAGLEDTEDAVQAVDDLMDRLNGGEWGVKREKSALTGASVLARALSKHSGKDIAVIRDFLKEKTAAEKLALRSNPAIAPIVAELEKNKKKKEKVIPNTDHLLSEIGA